MLDIVPMLRREALGDPALMARKVEFDESDLDREPTLIFRFTARERVQILTDFLDRHLQAQARFEDLFYRLAMRVREAESVLEDSSGGPVLKKVALRRLETVVRRLDDLLPDMRETTDRIELIAHHMKAISFRAGEADLKAARNDCVRAISEFSARARKCIAETDEVDRYVRHIISVNLH